MTIGHLENVKQTKMKYYFILTNFLKWLVLSNVHKDVNYPELLYDADWYICFDIC